MNIEEITKHWDGVSNGYRKLKFEEAKEHMQFLLDEVRRLQNIEKANRYLSEQIKSERLAFKNRSMSFLSDVQKLIDKYDPREAS